MPTIDEKKINAAEEQIEREKKSVDYDTREFTIEIVVQKYLTGEDKDENDIYVPEYQREFVWDEYRQSRLIESIILGLPIPLIFVAEIPETGRLEIVDGSQRIRTLAAFLNNELPLKGLTTLDTLNGFEFRNFNISRQRKFKNTAMRMIVLSSKATETVRNDMFDRINTSSLPLCPMEKRKGIYRGEFNDFVFRCAKNKTFKELCPIDFHFQNRQEEAELVLRFFAFSETYPKFFIDKDVNLERNGVERFLNNYLDIKNEKASDSEMKGKQQQFERMLAFVKATFKNGFAKRSDSKSTSRPYFEAIAVGTHLALEKKSDLKVTDLGWTNLDFKQPNGFYQLLSGRYHTHKPDKLRQRTEFVRNHLLKGKAE
ncbi:MAG: hypothetical protein BWK79_06215 [Beggiatoa sp. IS2]|nr:MAG: hypothetical protein BWK79_06215 [Beggiatoa sp. IS2]